MLTARTRLYRGYSRRVLRSEILHSFMRDHRVYSHVPGSCLPRSQPMIWAGQVVTVVTLANFDFCGCSFPWTTFRPRCPSLPGHAIREASRRSPTAPPRALRELSLTISMIAPSSSRIVLRRQLRELGVSFTSTATSAATPRARPARKFMARHARSAASILVQSMAPVLGVLFTFTTFALWPTLARSMRLTLGLTFCRFVQTAMRLSTPRARHLRLTLFADFSTDDRNAENGCCTARADYASVCI